VSDAIDEPDKPAEPTSLVKKSAAEPPPAARKAKTVAATPAAGGKAKAGSADPAPTSAERPRTVLIAVAAMAGSAVAALIAALSLYGQRDWLTREQVKTNNKAVAKAGSDAAATATKNHDSVADIASAKAKAIAKATKDLPNLHHQISQQQSGALIGTLVVVLALAVLGFCVYRGRHWSRWGMIAFWLLASFTGTVVGIGSILSIGSSTPAAFKVPSFLGAALLAVAVIFTLTKPSIAYFALNKPTPPADRPARRGLFAPRVPAGPAGTGAKPAAGAARSGPARAKAAVNSSAASRGEAYLDRQRSKKRANANADSVARGAELARSRAKASKSRRIES
jgi:hypothetical protein